MAEVRQIDLALLGRIAVRRRFEARTMEIATRLFVHGDTPKRLAIEFGINIQRVYAIRRLVEEAARECALPPGWTEVTFAGPADVVERLKNELAAALQAEQLDAPATTEMTTGSTEGVSG